MRIEVAGENSLIVYFAEQPGPNILAQINEMQHYLSLQLAQSLIDLIPSYTSLLITFDATKINHFEVRRYLQAFAQTEGKENLQDGNLVELPAYYGLDVGWDLQRIADKAGLAIEEVIERHQSQEYRVYAIGFAPGFAYLGHVDESIAMPRLSSPRANVPKGAIAIADRQTAVYPSESPGGWNIIGLCPIPMFDKIKEPATPLQVGDRVKFKAISKQQFLALGGVLTNG